MDINNDSANLLAQDELLIMCSQAGRVMYMSGGLRLSVGEDLTGRNLNDFAADKLVASIISRAQQGGQYRFELVLRDRVFSCVSEMIGENINISLTPLGGGEDGYINKNSAEFISREINVSLAMMLSAVRSMENTPAAAQNKNEMAVMRRNMYRLLRLSRNMLDCANTSNGALSLRLTQEDACEIIRELAGGLAPIMRKEKIDFHVEIPTKPIFCNVDRDKLERMVYNLIANSVMAVDSKREISLILAERGQSITITVTDRGRGIEPSLLQQVFSKHSRLSPGEQSGFSGAGFGLALVNSFARRHGGSLVITSLLGEGTSACVTLPKNAHADTLPLGSLNPDYAGGHSRVLVELSTALGNEFFVAEPYTAGYLTQSEKR